jgi:membrane protein YdbS with pleckstrin-like domain
MDEEVSKIEEPATETVQTTFRMSSTLFIFYVIVVVVAALSTIFLGNFTIFVAAVVIAALILAMLLVRFIVTSVSVQDKGLAYRTGWLDTTVIGISYDKINTVDIFVSLWGRLLNFGTVKVFSGNDVEGILLKGMEKPHALRAIIMERVSEAYKANNEVSAPAIDPADEIAKLDKLRDEGTITDEEFETKKKQLLGL